jgi:hypothetical protein
MGLELFPNRMGEFTHSDHKKTLKFLRFGFAVVSIICLLKELLAELLYFFVDLSGLVAVLNVLYFGMAAGSVFFKKLNQNKPICVLFLTCWSLTWTAVVFDQVAYDFCLDIWVWILAAIITVDYFLNKISFVRAQYIFPIGVLFIYLVTGFGLTALIDGNSLTDYIVVSVVSLVVAILTLEIGRFNKVRKCEDRQNEAALLRELDSRYD